MTKVMAIGAGAVAAGILASGLGAAVAAAQPPDVTGKRYALAARDLRSAGYRAEVGTVVGSQLPHNLCFVVNAANLTRVGVMGRQNSSPVRLDLHCYADPADHVRPGYSAGNASPQAEAVRDAYQRKLTRARQAAESS